MELSGDKEVFTMNNMLIAALVTGTIMTGCSGDSIVDGDNSGNLLLNSSFEQGGVFSLAGWQVFDTSAVKSSSDVPSNGGSYSVSIDAVWGLQGFIRTAVPAVPGTAIYQFSSWAKAVGSAGMGKMDLGLKQADSTHALKGLTVADSIWHHYSLIDTVTANAGDSLVITLSGGFSQLETGTTYYDLCRLERIR
jgi:hypothetical protein